MDILGSLFGGDRRQEDDYRDFLNRYDQGPPYAGISGREAYDRYEHVAGRIPPDLYEDSARDALNRLSPQERLQLGQLLRQQSGGRSPGFPGSGADDNQFQDSGFLAQVLGQMQRQQPGMMGQMLGGRGQSGTGGGLGDLMDNPVAKAALAGIAAMAVKKMMSR